MSLSVSDLKAVNTLLARARQYVDDALAVAEYGDDAVILRMLKPLGVRVRDTASELERRLNAAEQAEKK